MKLSRSIELRPRPRQLDAAAKNSGDSPSPHSTSV